MKMFSTSRPVLAMLLWLLIAAFIAPTVAAQTSGISSPTAGQTVTGVINVTGTATDANFLRFELAFLRDATPETGWIVFADGDQQVVNGVLATWDTTVGQNVNAPIYPDGSYQLRLRVVRNDFNYDEYFVGNIIIENGSTVDLPTQPPPPPPPTETPLPTEEAIPEQATEEPTLPPTIAPEQPSEQIVEDSEPSPTPTPSATPTPVPTATPLPTRDVPTAIPTIILEPTLEAPPEILPTLTPFPSPTPEATRDQTNFELVVPEGDDSAEQQIDDVNSFVEAVFDVDYSQFGSAFSRGVRWAFIGFALVGLYFAVRAIVRWLWQTISSNW